jgi:hypothetical protein
MWLLKITIFETGKPRRAILASELWTLRMTSRWLPNSWNRTRRIMARTHFQPFHVIANTRHGLHGMSVVLLPAARQKTGRHNSPSSMVERQPRMKPFSNQSIISHAHRGLAMQERKKGRIPLVVSGATPWRKFLVARSWYGSGWLNKNYRPI